MGAVVLVLNGLLMLNNEALVVAGLFNELLKRPEPDD